MAAIGTEPGCDWGQLAFTRVLAFAYLDWRRGRIVLHMTWFVDDSSCTIAFNKMTTTDKARTSEIKQRFSSQVTSDDNATFTFQIEHLNVAKDTVGAHVSCNQTYSPLVTNKIENWKSEWLRLLVCFIKCTCSSPDSLRNSFCLVSFEVRGVLILSIHWYSGSSFIRSSCTKLQ